MESKTIKVSDYEISKNEYNSVARNMPNASKEEIDYMVLKNIESFDLIKYKQKQRG